MSKVQFIRGLWGSDDKTLEYVKGSGDVDSKISPKVYAFGDTNGNILTQLNKNYELLDSNPMPYEDNCRAKLAVIGKALSEFPEIIFVDWHIRLNGDVPFNLQELRQGSPVKAALRMYRKRNCKWRPNDQRKIPASDLLYIKGIRVAKELIETWEGMDKPVTLEQVLMKYIDHLTGKWRGVDYYKSYFEIPFFAMSWEKELYGENKVNPAFTSLKDIKEIEAQVKAEDNPEPVTHHPIEAILTDRQAVPEPLEIKEKTLRDKTSHELHPIEMDSWTSNLSRAR